MTEIFDSKFHMQYVGGKGEVAERPVVNFTYERTGQTYEDVLSEYRWYIGDPTAELPEEIWRQLEIAGKV